ncbi:MAG: acyl-CoA dehydrogenase [Gammaproteobacteria bacterium]
MLTLTWILILVGGILVMVYQGAGLAAISAGLLFYAVIYAYFGNASWWLITFVIASLLLILPLNVKAFRRNRITKPLFKLFRQVLPSMSDTEREALEAGTVWWEGELFSGKPNWKKLTSMAAPTLSKEEQDFIDGPVEELCGMLDDWTLCQEYADIPDEIFEFVNSNGFLGMIIPKRYGGLELSAYAQSEVINKINALNSLVALYISVPNSLGPGELLMKYGTDEQKDYYLPRLAKGEEVPCFGLTGPRAGSDATSIPDTGVVCKGNWEGEEVIGIKLNFSKRYITLAPVATLVGLAFKLSDPDGLIGDKEDYGISCALIPRHTPGVRIGRRHYPVGSPFLNGPIQGEDVFIPVDYLIGGTEMAGQGWRMLVECLSVGRCVSLPSGAISNAKRAFGTTSAYSRLRKQFGIPIGKFEGVQEALARITGNTYIIDAARSVTTSAIAAGEEPAVPSAILKYHCTELARQVINDSMDIHGGKAAIQGPKNYLAEMYKSMPVAITVEGANIMTRSLIIFGQGAIRCHPYVLKEMEAARDGDENKALRAFDEALFAHIGMTLSNAVRSLFMGLTGARLVRAPGNKANRRYFQQVQRFSANFALLADATMLMLGGGLKKKEMISARLGDLLSYLYLTSMVLKHYQDQGEQEADQVLLDYACGDLLCKLQEQMHLLLQNLPNRLMATLLRAVVFPTGRPMAAVSDDTKQALAEAVIQPSELRSRLLKGAYLSAAGDNPLHSLNQALEMAESVEELEAKVSAAEKEGKVIDTVGAEQIDDAEAQGVLTSDEANKLREFDSLVMSHIHVDDFAYDEIGKKPLRPQAEVDRKKLAAESSTPDRVAS